MRVFLWALSIAVAANASAAQAAWLCIADKATGFSYSEQTQKWETTTFRTQSSRYVVGKGSWGKDVWTVREFGKPTEGLPFARCEKDFSEYGFLSCRGLAGRFDMNRKNNRYLLTFQGQYLAYNPNSDLAMLRKDGGDTPLIEIGTCSQI